MKRSEIRRIFRQHRGEAAELARQLNKTSATISLVLKGRTPSARILAAAEARAKELQAADLEREERDAAA